LARGFQFILSPPQIINIQRLRIANNEPVPPEKKYIPCQVCLLFLEEYFKKFLALIADWVLHLSKGNLVAAICLILWVSAIMSAFVDNIPFTATMLPITAYLTKVIPGAAESNVLWWALALGGVCLGGNGTIIGASANVVTVGIAEASGHHISFFGFMKYAFLYMLISVAICNV
jgi:Na+/H+ antiporter NhaD/arsenite permease-like protein